MLSGAGLVAGIVGEPVRHSLSPFLHGRWIAALGLDAAYVPFAPRGEAGFRRLLEGFRGGAVRGVNVTAPFKRLALDLADQADSVAQEAGSANLLLFEADGRVQARSTDGEGVTAALAARAPGLQTGTALMIGAGGAASAAVAALRRAGWRVRVANRTLATAEALGDEAFALAELERAAEGAAVVINALSVEPPPLKLAPGTAVLDMRYRPHEPPFLTAAAAQGALLIHGIDMLIAQAIPSFEAFFGVRPPHIPGLREEAVRLAAAPLA